MEQDPWSWFAALTLSLPSPLPIPRPLGACSGTQPCLLPSSLDAVDAEQAGQEQGWSYCFSYEVTHLHSVISNQMPRSASSEIQSTAKSSCIDDALSKKYILKVQCKLFFSPQAVPTAVANATTCCNTWQRCCQNSSSIPFYSHL